MQFENFEPLEEEKKRRIINAALKEFTLSGYERASTVKIAKEAGISKGALFHYFRTKEELYHFLMDYSMKNVEEQVLAQIPDTKMNLIDHYKYMTDVKHQLYLESPHLFDFLFKAYQEEVAIDHYLEEVNDVMDRYKKTVAASLDHTRFKKGISLDKAIKISTYLFQGLGMEYARAHSKIDLEDIKREGYELLDLLGQLILEEEE